MKFIETPIGGAFMVEMERIEDERGFFARTWCAEDLASRGLDARLAQCSVSFSKRKGTLRGMHYQTAPHREAKLVRCSRGAVYDVIVDARPASPTEGRYFAIELTEDTPAMIYVPEGVAHGFMTLTDAAELAYGMSVRHEVRSEGGFRWDDPAVGIRWPQAPACISSRDRELPSFAMRRQP